MAEQIPILARGDTVRIMQVDTMVNSGLANKIGTLQSVIGARAAVCLHDSKKRVFVPLAYLMKHSKRRGELEKKQETSNGGE